MRISDWSSDVCSSDLVASIVAGGELTPDGERVITVIALAILLEDTGLSGCVRRAAIGFRDFEGDFALAQRIEDCLVQVRETDATENKTLGFAEARRYLGRSLEIGRAHV